MLSGLSPSLALVYAANSIGIKEVYVSILHDTQPRDTRHVNGKLFSHILHRVE